jgi:hypothetical protein
VWVYSTDDPNDMDGTCVSEFISGFECENITRVSDCDNGNGIGDLVQKCKNYNGVCKERCFSLTNEECISRDIDCYYNGTDCLERVC